MAADAIVDNARLVLKVAVDHASIHRHAADPEESTMPVAKQVLQFDVTHSLGPHHGRGDLVRGRRDRCAVCRYRRPTRLRRHSVSGRSVQLDSAKRWATTWRAAGAFDDVPRRAMGDAGTDVGVRRPRDARRHCRRPAARSGFIVGARPDRSRDVRDRFRAQDWSLAMLGGAIAERRSKAKAARPRRSTRSAHEEREMIKGVKFVSIPVRDQDRALEFYTKTARHACDH